MWSEWTENDVDVVGHHYEGCKFVSLSIKVLECVGNNFGDSWLAQNTRANALIQPMIKTCGETLAVFLTGACVPRLWMCAEPQVAGFFPFSHESAR